MQSVKKHLVNILKISLAVGLITWMISSGKLDLYQLKILINRGDIFAMNLALWIFVPVLLGTYRWHTLLLGLNLFPTYFRTMQLQLIGFFFNTAVPGAVGGDIIKAIYVMREQGAKNRTPALMTILLDRIIGLFGLFTLGGIGILIGYSHFKDLPQLRPMIAFVGGFLLLMIIFATLTLIPYKEGRDPFKKLFTLKLPGLSIFQKLYSAIREYRNRPSALIKAYCLSIVIQFLSFCYFYTLSKALVSEDISPITLAVIYPIGVLTTALPITPGGLGVGHGAFDFLFKTIGLEGGANVFNVFCLGQLSLNLLGIIPYLFSKGSIPDLKDLDEEFA